MYNHTDFLKRINEFILSDKKIALIKGYTNTFKLISVLKSLNQYGGSGQIHTAYIGNLKEIVNMNTNTPLIPKKIKADSVFNIGNMNVTINLYEKTNSISFNQNDFSIYYPVQTALLNSKRERKLIDHLSKNNSNKIFIVTTNDWSISTENIEAYCDDLIIYDIQQDDPEKYNILYNNMNGNLPY